MRLIDADKLNRNDMCDHCRSACCGDCIGNDDFVKWIKSQPTAYDPEKVVEQLKVEAWEFESFDYENAWVVDLPDAIEIVERGGANET